jgi:hypothetical protein
MEFVEERQMEVCKRCTIEIVNLRNTWIELSETTLTFD